MLQFPFYFPSVTVKFSWNISVLPAIMMTNAHIYSQIRGLGRRSMKVAWGIQGRDLRKVRHKLRAQL